MQTEHEFLTENQPLVFAQIKKSVEHERLAHAYLFEGEQGTGKDIMSRWLAKRLFCTNVVDNEPCNTCNNCLRIQQEEHPNVQRVAPDGQSIKVDQIRRLQAEFTKSGFEEKLQMFIIQDAEKMNVNAANSLLKFLEEPQGSFVAVLETEALGRILPTIQSRCQVIHFNPLNEARLIAELQQQGIGTESAQLLASLTNSLQKSIEISQEEWFNETKEAAAKWYTFLKRREWQAFVYVQKALVPLVKDKQQQQILLQMMLYYFQKDRDREGNDPMVLGEANRNLELILKAMQKLRANVAFQAVVEQLAIRIVKGS